MQTPPHDKRNAEHEIFKLHKGANLFLRAGDAEAFERIQTTIAELQRTSGAMSGRGKGTENAGIDY